MKKFLIILLLSLSISSAVFAQDEEKIQKLLDSIGALINSGQSLKACHILYTLITNGLESHNEEAVLRFNQEMIYGLGKALRCDTCNLNQIRRNPLVDSIFVLENTIIAKRAELGEAYMRQEYFRYYFSNE